ncbi:MAG: ATP-dependent sacrificial sulfur transferase LarE, partial [Candidatus Omnitrophica bacterium]|nr:ATP-dependent sacrificial sulfur transferase LarE [Candidatus Omnitrophota bacterium]
MTNHKLGRLKDIIQSYESVLVAFSGGVDSTFVLKVARDVLGRDLAKAATASSPSVPRREIEAAKELVQRMDVEHRMIHTHELENQNYKTNPLDRCYFCKSELYETLFPIAEEWNLKTIVNGTNLDDLGDFRPGLKAADEHGIRSPLVEAELTKSEIRGLARALGLPIWDKPASPCLSSRFPYGDEITSEKLKQVENGENFLKDLGFQVMRLRHFGEKARVELGREEFVRVMDVALRNQITDFIRSLGFKTVVFEPYQSGILNEEVKASR